MALRNIKTVRILLYAEGDFSYTYALCNKIADDESKYTYDKYEIIATDFAKHDEKEICNLLEKINKMIQEKKLEGRITISILGNVDATKKDERISGQFDRIICNFPTPFGKERLKIEEMLLQIKENNLLKEYGKFQISYWVDDYSGTYEYAYRLAKAQKKLGFELKSREIVDLKELRELGYQHNLSYGDKNQIDHLPIVSTFQLKQNTKKILEEDEYDELSDSESLPNDAMPTRWTNRYHGTSHSSENLNFHGKEEPRWSWRLKLFNENPAKYSIEVINSLIRDRRYREAERRLTVLIEAGVKNQINFGCDERFYHWIQKIIYEHYENAKIKKPDETNLQKYHQYDWYTKLKILAGVKIPELSREYRWN